MVIGMTVEGSERLTWEEIQEKYPDQWVGMVDVKFEPDNDATVKSAIVKYIDLSKSILTEMMLDGKCFSRYTTPDHVFWLGALML